MEKIRGLVGAGDCNSIQFHHVALAQWLGRWGALLRNASALMSAARRAAVMLSVIVSPIPIWSVEQIFASAILYHTR